MKWAPASGTQPSPCTASTFQPYSGDPPTRTCRKPFTRSGTLTVYATVNGDVKQKSVAIEVTPRLTLTATPQAVQPGGSVTFSYTVTGTGGAWVGNPTWVWQPDSGQGGLSSPCYSQNPCTRALTKSGTMTVTVVVYPGDNSQDALTASVHVSVPPCQTGNPMIDSPEVQPGLNDLFASSLTDGVERGAWLMQRSDGSYYLEPFPLEWPADACGIDPPLGTLPPGGAVSWVHTHPWGKGDQMTQCPGLVFGGVEIPFNYTNNSSREDDQATEVWGPGWLIDKNLMRKFDGAHNTPGNYLEDYSCCGY